jgi:hypothetical protein
VSDQRAPKVLVIDDDPESQRAVFRSTTGVEATFEVVHPDDVDAEMLDNADLVLVDYLLEHWPARDKLPQIGLKPANGVALAAVLREQANRIDRPTGFAIHTGKPDELWLSPAEPRRHLIARSYNLEWVFLKSNPTDVIRHATILASAIRSLPQRWPGDDHERALQVVKGLLGLAPWSGEETEPAWLGPALTEVENCRPPLTELSERNHGLVFLRWLLHRILPYPCFLLDTHRLAARLRISHTSLQQALATGLGEFLLPCCYRGALAGFLGERWWRAGVEDLLWSLTDEVTVPPNILRAKLSAKTGAELAPSVTDSPIVCVDENYQALPEACPADVVVRIQPDDWPLYASQAWTTVELARQHARLRAVVVAEDREKVDLKEDPAPRAGGDGE